MLGIIGKKSAKVASAFALCAMTIATPVQAADCWSSSEVSAAKVRDLQTMLMVAALRCRGTEHNLLSDYNRFINTQRSVLQSINARLLNHFTSSYGPLGQRKYDSFTTSLANTYGAGNGTDCSTMTDIAQEASNGTDEAHLVSMSEGLGLSPSLPSQACPVQIAVK